MKMAKNMEQALFSTIMADFTKGSSLTTLRMAQDTNNFPTDLNIKATFSKELNKEKDSSNGQMAKFMKESLAMVPSMAPEFGLPLINKVTSASGPMEKFKVLVYILINMEIVMKVNLKTPRNQVQVLNVSIMAKLTSDSIARIVRTAWDSIFGLMAATIKVNS